MCGSRFVAGLAGLTWAFVRRLYGWWNYSRGIIPTCAWSSAWNDTPAHSQWRKSPMMPTHAIPGLTAAGGLLAALSLTVTPAHRTPNSTLAVSAKLSEWKVELSEGSIAAGTVTFTIANSGSIPHAFEVEGQGIERQTAVIQPGASAALTLNLKPGTYEVYCPVGEDSHKMLGMLTHL